MAERRPLVNISGSVRELPAGDSLPASGVVVTVDNGASTTTARPAGASIVYWLGTAQPANALVGDIWWSPV